MPVKGTSSVQVHGRVEGFEGLYIIGWAITGSGLENSKIEVKSPDGQTIAAARASRHRADLAEVGKGRTNISFRIPLPKLAPKLDGVDRLHVYADGTELPGSPLPIGTGVYDGSVTVNGGSVEGWITARALSFDPPTINIVSHDGCTLAVAASHFDATDTDPFFRPARFSCRIDQRWFGRPEVGLRVLANDKEFARTTCRLGLTGYIDTLSAQQCSGWLLSPDAPARQFEIEILRNGEVVGKGLAGIPREDLRDLHPLSWKAGFQIALDSTKDGAADGAVFSFRLAGGGDTELFGGPFFVGRRSDVVSAAQAGARLAHTSDSANRLARSILQAALAQYIESKRFDDEYVRLKCRREISRERALNIIIPVYRDVAITADCIYSVVTQLRPSIDHLIVVNDCSPEPEMAQFLRTAGVFVVTNDRNLGFVQTVNRALGFCPHGDVLLLNSDTKLFPGALEELHEIAHSARDIGTVTALSNNATIFTYPSPGMTSDSLDDIRWEEVARVAMEANRGMVVDVPTGHGFCMLVKREVLDLVGSLDERFGRGYGEENALCLRAADSGYRNVAAGGVFVEHRESVSFGTEKEGLRRSNLKLLSGMYPEYTRLIMDFERRDDLRRVRWAIDAHRLRQAAMAGQSFALVVDNWLPGGIKKAVRDIESVVGYGDARKLSLSCGSDGSIHLRAEQPLIRAVFAADEVRELLELLSAIRIELVLIHQLLGFGRDLIAGLSDWIKDRHAVAYLHDFYSVCPRTTLINAVGEFCGVAGSDVCGRCVALGGAHEASRLGGVTPDEHRDLFGELLRNARHVVAPSKNTGDYINRVFPAVKVTVLPHPQDGTAFPEEIRKGSNDEIVLLGAIGSHKGSAKLLEIARRAWLSHPHLRFNIIGFTDIDEALAGIGNVTISGKFEAAELPALLDKAQGRMALFLHGWPETFSYTLTEAVQAGFLPLVPDIGAPAERVKAAGFGVVFDFPIDAVQVLGLIDSLRGDVSRIGGDPRSFRLDGEWEKRALRVFRPQAPHHSGTIQAPVSQKPQKRQTGPKVIKLADRPPKISDARVDSPRR